MDIAPPNSTVAAVFTGLVEEVGTVVGLRRTQTGRQLEIAAPRIAGETSVGASVAVNGCCLTVASREAQQLAFDLLQETVERTNLAHLQADQHVNLERALRASDRLGGHFVQGHIDCTASIVDLTKRGADYRLEVELRAQFEYHVVPKASIAVDGISLTIAEVLSRSFVVWIIPHTQTHTNVSERQAGDLVNLEFDILAKYVQRLLEGRAPDDVKAKYRRHRIGGAAARS